MEKLSQKELDWLLQPNDSFRMGIESGPEVQRRSASPKRSPTKIFLLLLSGVLGLIFPFFLLIRTSVYLIRTEQWNGWVALVAGSVVTILFLWFLFVIIFRRAKHKKIVYKIGIGSLSMMVFGFCMYGLMYLSGVNAKTENVRQVYRSLHPVLRVAVATTTLADKDLIITDIKRSPEDYRAMGLNPRQTSLHYPQKTGFVHAIDLRTIGHSEFRNKLLEISLKTMGFQTIRHVGTADHLYVALPLN